MPKSSKNKGTEKTLLQRLRLKVEEQEEQASY